MLVQKVFLNLAMHEKLKYLPLYLYVGELHLHSIYATRCGMLPSTARWDKSKLGKGRQTFNIQRRNQISKMKGKKNYLSKYVKGLCYKHKGSCYSYKIIK